MANIYSEYGIGTYDDPYSNMGMRNYAGYNDAYSGGMYDDPYSSMEMRNYANAINQMYGAPTRQVPKAAGASGTKGGSKFGPGKEQGRVVQPYGAAQSAPALIGSSGGDFQQLSPMIGRDMGYTKDLTTFLELLRQLGPLLYG